MKRGGEPRAGVELPKNRVYPKELVERMKHRYLTHVVLGYLPRPGIMGAMSREFGIEPRRILCLLQYNGVV